MCPPLHQVTEGRKVIDNDLSHLWTESRRRWFHWRRGHKCGQAAATDIHGREQSKSTANVHICTHMHEHTHTHALMSCRDQQIRLQPVLDPIRLSNMSANSHSVPSAVEKGTHRQQEHEPVEHLFNIWQKTDSLGNRAQGQPFPFPTRELSDWWFGCISKVRLWRDNRNVPGWQCIHAQLCYRKGPLSSEPSATLEMTVASLKLPDCYITCIST